MSIRCVIEARSVLGEGAYWSTEEKKLYWIDQMRPEVHCFDPATGEDALLDVELPAQLGALARRASGGLILAASDGITLLQPTRRKRTTLVNPIADQPRVSFNDAKCDRQGRLWAGTTDRLETDPVGQLYRIDLDARATVITDGYICSNGPSFSPDGLTMYHTRSHDGTIHAYDIVAETGAAVNGRVFARVDPKDGIPDGSTVDAEGFLWSTHWGGWRITRYRPDGTVDRVVEMPIRSPTSCAFGGSDLGTLFVTSASITMENGQWVYLDDAGFAAAPLEGGLFAIDVGVCGVEESPFRG